RDKAGNYWFGMRTGLVKADADFKQYTFVQAFNNKIIRSVSLNHLSALTVGTNDGLFIKSDTSWLRLGKADGLDNEYVNMVLADFTRNCTWLATNDGLLRYDGKVIQMAYPGLRCTGMLLDKRQYLWVSTSKGLLYYDGQQMSMFSESHGIPQNLLNLSYDEDNDTFYILSNNSVTKFSAQTILTMADPQAPAIYIPEHTINGKVHAVFTDRINELTESVSTLTLTISAPYHGQTDRWILFYRLNGKAWTRAGNTSKLNFVELPYGEVSIELQMRDEINNIQSAPLTVFYLIPTPWYRTKMGIAGLLILILILASFLSYLLIQRIELKKQKRFLAKQRRAELEHKVLRNMLNPHFLNNALNAIQVFVTRNDQRRTLGYLSKFARLMRINLELLEKSLVPLEKELNNIELYLEFEILRSEDKLNYVLEIDPAINQTTIKVPSLVLQPFVENAIWHGILPKTTGGQVGIYIKQINRLLHISIVDNGIGLEESKKRKNLSPDSK
ncbi:MAG: hypothetical protein EBU52_20795, partial [Cytophagia bacterium]|nr:hypothetical protein [Cytophagia bacterium]